MDIEKLKSLRKEKKLSQRRLADAAGIAFATVQRAEKSGDINVNTLEKLAGVLGVSAGVFFP